MNARKLLLVGCAALLVVALAAPAAASASVWKHGETPLEEHVEFGVFGSEIFVTEAGGMICEVQATLTTEGGGSGQLGNYEVTNCMGLFGELASCTVTAAEQPGGPWAVDVNTENLTITGAAIKRSFDPGCPIETLDSSIAEVGTTLYEPAAITEFEYSGEGTAQADGGPEVEYSSFGSYFVAGAASGTYGIG